MPDVVVVGGGVGGLAASIRLRATGRSVTVLERHDVVGGKLAVRERDGFTFDVGPSLVTMPHLFDDLFRAVGSELADEVEMVRLDPQFTYRWPDGHELVMRDDGCDEPGWRQFVARGKRIWDVSERTFLAGPMAGPLSLMRRMRSPMDLISIDPLRTLHRSAERDFDDPRMVQWAGRYATYSGSSPFRAPATLGCIAHVESAFGCWYPLGGLGAIRQALERIAERAGVEIARGADVTSIITGANGAVSGVRTADGTTVTARTVIANVDAVHLYRDLLPEPRRLRRIQRAAPSTSGVAVIAGVRGTTPGVTHHNVWFSADDRREFDELDAGRLATDPTIYGCVSSVTDPSQAPPDHENWFLLVNAPAGAQVDDSVADRILAHLATRGVDLRERVLFTETITPADLAARYRSTGGAIYGTSSNGRRAAFARPGNRGAVAGLYLVGGSSHPGGGLPLVLTSARIVADMVAAS